MNISRAVIEESASETFENASDRLEYGIFSREGISREKEGKKKGKTRRALVKNARGSRIKIFCQD
jgi:hypothetical protein